MKIGLLRYEIIVIILSIIAIIILIENFKLRKQIKEKMKTMEELEAEMRYRFNLRSKKNE